MPAASSDFSRSLFSSLKIQGLVIAGVPLMLAGWTLAARNLSLDPTFASRCAVITCLPVLLAALFYPLLARVAGCKRVFIVNWFLIAGFFNLWWEVPQVVFMDYFHQANQAISLEKLPYFIPWWGYTTSDLDYFQTNRYFVLAEVSFWVINLLSLVGMGLLRRGRELPAMLWFLVCAALQVYNIVAIYFPHGLIVEQGRNIADDSVLAPIVFWAMNLMWAVAAATAAVFSFERVMELQRPHLPVSA